MEPAARQSTIVIAIMEVAFKFASTLVQDRVRALAIRGIPRLSMAFRVRQSIIAPLTTGVVLKIAHTQVPENSTAPVRPTTLLVSTTKHVNTQIFVNIITVVVSMFVFQTQMDKLSVCAILATRSHHRIFLHVSRILCQQHLLYRASSEVQLVEG